jgi:hypothetical protein
MMPTHPALLPRDSPIHTLRARPLYRWHPPRPQHVPLAAAPPPRARVCRYSRAITASVAPHQWGRCSYHAHHPTIPQSQIAQLLTVTLRCEIRDWVLHYFSRLLLLLHCRPPSSAALQHRHHQWPRHPHHLALHYYSQRASQVHRCGQRSVQPHSTLIYQHNPAVQQQLLEHRFSAQQQLMQRSKMKHQLPRLLLLNLQL